jgi:hypothetical protein
MKKITLATIKSFIKNNKDNLYIRIENRFDGMTDCVMPRNDGFPKVVFKEESIENTLGIQGAWFVGRSRDYFGKFEYVGQEGEFEGFKISNSCGSFKLARKIKPTIGDKRTAFCVQANCDVEQEYVGLNGGGNGDGWLCLHK